MRRRILIITNAGKIGTANYCDGVFKDKENYVSFFKSACGGYYSDLEIRTFDKPLKSKIDNEISLLYTDDIEFSIVIFCGHGFYSTYSNSNILQLNDNDGIDSLDLRKWANKRIIIEDNCREKCDEYLNESLTKALNSNIRIFDSRGKTLNPEECKRYYNKTVADCSEQIICAMACDIDETAGDSSSRGGYYSNSLLKGTKKIVADELQSINLSTEYRAFNFPKCHNVAIPLVQGLSGNKQNPQIDKPRFIDEKKYLPFAIIA
jgi:hypothetical protein